MLLSNNSYDNHGIHDNIVLPDITILKISLRYRLSWHFDIMINDNIVILPNSSICSYPAAILYLSRHMQYTMNAAWVVSDSYIASYLFPYFLRMSIPTSLFKFNFFRSLVAYSIQTYSYSINKGHHMILHQLLLHCY